MGRPRNVTPRQEQVTKTRCTTSSTTILKFASVATGFLSIIGEDSRVELSFHRKMGRHRTPVSPGCGFPNALGPPLDILSASPAAPAATASTPAAAAATAATNREVCAAMGTGLPGSPQGRAIRLVPEAFRNVQLLVEGEQQRQS